MITKNFWNHFKNNLEIAIPVCLSQVGHVMVGVVDSIMVGKLGKEPLAASALSNSIFSVPLLFGIGISYGLTPLVAAFNGQKDLYNAGMVFKHGMVINIITGLALSILFYNLSYLIFYLNQPKEVVLLTIPYFQITMISLLPVMVFQGFKQFMEGLSLTKHAMFISLGGNFFNIILNYILIYGKLGFPTLGLNGAAISTLIARVLMAVSMFAFMFYSKKFQLYLSKINLKGYSSTIFKQILNIGIPSAFQFVFEVTAFSLAAVMMGWIGTRELAAHQIAISLAALTYMFATGFSAGAVVRVGNFLGLKNKSELRTAGFSSFLIVVVFMTICAIVFIITRKLLPTLYIDDQKVIEIASSLLVVAAFFQISDGVQVVSLGALRGLKDVKIPTLITFIAYWVLGLPIGYILANYFKIGAIGIWIGLMIGLTVSAVLLLIRFNYKSRQIIF